MIKLVTGEDATFTDPQLAGQRLGSLLDAGPRRLLVLDDVWDPQQLAPFAEGGKACARLVTTRVPDLVVGRTVAVRVDQMSPEQARAVLTSGLPPLDSSVVQGLLAVTGRWPLLLRLVSKILADYAQLAADVSAQGMVLLERLRTGGPAAVDDLLGDDGLLLDVSKPHQRTRAVRATLEASISLLERHDAERFAELGVFAEDEAIPFSLIARLWRATAGLKDLESARVCHRLVQLALVSEAAGPVHSIAMHNVVRDLVRAELGHQRLVGLGAVLLDAVATGLPEASPLGHAGLSPVRVAWWASANMTGTFGITLLSTWWIQVTLSVQMGSLVTCAGWERGWRGSALLPRLLTLLRPGRRGPPGFELFWRARRTCWLMPSRLGPWWSFFVCDGTVITSVMGAALPLLSGLATGDGRAAGLTRGGVVLTVNADRDVVERQLGDGELACPSCGGVLARWGNGARRRVRLPGRLDRPDGHAWLVPRRSRCRECGVTHILLPPPRRARGGAGRAERLLPGPAVPALPHHRGPGRRRLPRYRHRGAAGRADPRPGRHRPGRGPPRDAGRSRAAPAGRRGAGRRRTAGARRGRSRPGHRAGRRCAGAPRPPPGSCLPRAQRPRRHRDDHPAAAPARPAGDRAGRQRALFTSAASTPAFIHALARATLSGYEPGRQQPDARVPAAAGAQ